MVSAVLSAFLINDVVCIAVTPLVLQIVGALDRDPRPYLLALATSSNIGSVATITGNPQNILIGSLSHVSYRSFSAALAPVALLSLVANVAIIWVVHRRTLGGEFAVQAERPRPRIYERWIYKSGIVTGLVLVAFVAGVPPIIAALVGAAAMLVTRAVKPKRIYGRVDWTLLALFAGLFVVIGAVEKTGLADRIFAFLVPLRVDSVWGLTLVVAALSNIVSNVPAVMMLRSLVPRLAHPESAWLVVAMASTLAGNLTLPGSIATVIVVERAKSRAKISFVDFLKVGFLSGIVSLVIGATWLWWIGR